MLAFKLNYLQYYSKSRDRWLSKWRMRKCMSAETGSNSLCFSRVEVREGQIHEKRVWGKYLLRPTDLFDLSSNG